MTELTGRDRMALLCESFPTLREAPGTMPWDQHKFARWASSGAATSGITQAAAFVLSVWNGSQPEDGGWWNEGKNHVGRFDPVHAMAVWDVVHIAAFIQWCKRPFWP